jgi:hypothetical protein
MIDDDVMMMKTIKRISARRFCPTLSAYTSLVGLRGRPVVQLPLCI